MRQVARHRRAPSLARRMILGLVAFLALIGLLAILAEPIRKGWPSPRQWLALEQARQLLETSIGRDPTGALAFQPTTQMIAYMAAAPDFWFVASDGGTPVRGGIALHENKDARGTRVSMLQGTTAELETAVGPVGVLLGGQRGDLLDGAGAWLGKRLPRWLVAVAIVALCTTALTIGLVHLLLRPVRRAAQAAMALTPGQGTPALPTDGVPIEILPLVTATNGAFARLEREHDRQRQFIANAAHELRTPIAILSVRLDELPAGPAKQRLCQDMARLTMLANQLLDLERLHHSGPGTYHPVDLVALTRDVVADIAPLAIDNGSTVSFQSVPPRWEIQGDEQALRGVFYNLMGNALAHGGPAVNVALRIDATGAIEVADQGIGVPAEARERVFEAFQRGGGTGTGLGLYIVREVLRAHGATIELREGRPGAVFRIRF
jgi:signal transduction histidine kinase